jgi:CubicO group peptidase (beta-lactamase class C family)
MRRKFVSMVVAIAALATAGAADRAIARLDETFVTPTAIEETVQRLMRAANVPGLAVAILNDRKVAYVHAFGERDRDRHLPLTVDSVMTAASFSKSAFACLVMQLVEERTLDLDKPVYEYLAKPLPEYTRYRDLAGDDRYRRITARMLLSHTAGFPNLRAFNRGQLNINFEPGSRYAYSGEGIQLLQLIVEEVTGVRLHDLMQSRIFAPFGMTRTSMVWQLPFERDFANGYDRTGRSLGPQRRRVADAAGSMQTSIADFSRFVSAVMHGKALKRSTRTLMLTPQVTIRSRTQFPTLTTETTDRNDAIGLSYGLGWGLFFTPRGKAFFKEGHDDGWQHYAVAFDDRGLAIVLMSNSANAEGIFPELLERLIANTYTPVEWEGYVPYDREPPPSR